MLCFQDPRKPHVRDLAIAQKVFTSYGNSELTPTAVAWVEPLSPILGWNGGDEFATTDLTTGYGDIQTDTDWSLNLPLLMAETEKLNLPAMKSFDPRTIDWNDSRSAVAFIQTDGDNAQWVEGDFFGNASYWGNSERGKIPYGWSCCFAHLAQLCPEAIQYALDTRSPNDWFIEWGGGYYYPDRFGLKLANRWDLLAQQAGRTWELMKKTNTRVIGFNFTRIDSRTPARLAESSPVRPTACWRSLLSNTIRMREGPAAPFGSRTATESKSRWSAPATRSGRIPTIASGPARRPKWLAKSGRRSIRRRRLNFPVMTG
jgi:hypothetical protein